MNVHDIFNVAADSYDKDRAKVIPCFDLFYGTLVHQIPFPTDTPLRILDVGAGTGLETALLTPHFPQATFVLTDLSEEMLALARKRFHGSARHECRLLDCRDLHFHEEFGVVISTLSLHLVSDDQKRAVYARIFEALKPGGVFIQGDKVLGPTPALEEVYQKTWVDGMRTSGLEEDRIEAAFGRNQDDCNAPLSDQLNWLRGVGFREVDCWFKYYRFAVFGGRK